MSLDLDQIPESIRDFAAAIAAQADAPDRFVNMIGVLAEKLKTGEGARLGYELRRAYPDHPLLWSATETLVRKVYPHWYIDAVNDTRRNEAYRKSIEASVSNDTLVLEVGTGSGLFAMQAARAGAAHVYTFEHNPRLAAVAAENIARNGLSDRITVSAKSIKDAELGTDVPQRCGLLIHEFSSSTLPKPEVLDILASARERLLEPGAVSLPLRSAVLVQLAGDPALARISRMPSSVDGFEVAGFDPVRSVNRRLPWGYSDPRPLSAPTVAAEVVFGREHADLAQAVDVQATGGGSAQGLVQWIRQEFPGGQVYENGPETIAYWHQHFWPFATALTVEAGQRVSLAVAVSEIGFRISLPASHAAAAAIEGVEGS